MIRVKAIVMGLLCTCAVSAAATPTSSPLDAVVLLDESGSMYGNPRKGEAAQDPEFRRLAAVQCLARKMRPGDRLAVVPFGTMALPSSAIALADPFAGAGIEWAPLGARAREGAAAQDATNYADALRAAVAAFGPIDSARSRVVILLSDGAPNAAGNDVATLEREAAGLQTQTGARLYALGLGGDVRMDLLEDLAGRGGGRSVAVRRAEDLPFAFARVFREAGGREVRTPEGKDRFRVGPNAGELKAIAVSGSPFALIAPDGRRFEPAEDSAVFPDGQRDHVHWLRVPEPMAGTWRIDGDPSGVDVGYESSLHARLESPSAGGAVPNSSSLRIAVRAEGAEPGDRLRGEAVLRTSDGQEKTVPLRFHGDEGAADVDLENVPSGAALLRVRVRREFDDGTEEGVPAEASLSLIQAPPGVPAVAAQWPSAMRIDVEAGEVARASLRLVATKEAVGRTVVVRADRGFRVERRVALARDTKVDLEIRGPYEGVRGDFPTTLALSPEDPALVVQDGSWPVVVHATNWIDRLLLLARIGLPLIATGLCLFGLVACAGLRWRWTRRLRVDTLRSIRLLHDGADVVRDNGRLPSIRQRTFGGEEQDARLQMEPPVKGLLLTVSVPRGRARPTELAFQALALTVPNREIQDDTVVLGSGTNATLEIPDAEGDVRVLGASFHYDAPLALRIDLLTRLLYGLVVLLVVSLAWSAWNWTRDFDRQTRGREIERRAQ